MADDERHEDPGAYIGHEPERAAETIPGGVGPRDERVAANSTQSTGVGRPDERGQFVGDGGSAGDGHSAGDGGSAGDGDSSGNGGSPARGGSPGGGRSA